MVTTSLLDRDPTPEDLEAERDAPRPGVWAGQSRADLRALTQDETDALIRYELCDLDAADAADVVAACGGRPKMIMLEERPRQCAYAQRGGIDSDPLVRVLARRAWGDRDRTWFELRGVRKSDAIRVMELRSFAGSLDPTLRETGEMVIARSHGSDWPAGTALADARPGELVMAMVDISRIPGSSYARHGIVDVMCRVSDRLREPPPHRERATPTKLEAELEEASQAFGFDALYADRNEMTRDTTLTAERGRYQARVRVTDQKLADASSQRMAVVALCRRLGVLLGNALHEDLAANVRGPAPKSAED